MAWRLDESVVRGEIDNTVEGRTTGRIWLAGREEPLVLDLEGDCLRDLAGTRLVFSNPSPVRNAEFDHLASEQTGSVGDMTASRRCRVPKFGPQDFDPAKEDHYVWRNFLYLEWFSRGNGRVLVESDEFELELSEGLWRMDEDAESAQEMANMHEMREFVRQVVGRMETDEPGDPPSGELDEYAWEARLKESDRVSDAYQEVLEKYMDDPDSERKEAFVMGWDGLLEAMAERDEEEDGEFPDEEEDDQDEDPDSWMSDEERLEENNHPLQEKAQEIALRAMDLVERESAPDSPAQALLGNLLQVTGKLAGALNGWGDGYEPETGYVLAVLKRCLNWLNEAVSACQELIAMESDPDHRAALVHLRSSIFEIRDGITEIRRELNP